MDNVTLLQAIAFARSRGVLLPADYYALDLNSRQYASTVSYLAGLDQIQSVLDSAYKVFCSCLDLGRVSCPPHLPSLCIFLSRAF